MRSFALFLLALLLTPGHAVAEEEPAPKPKKMTVTSMTVAIRKALKAEDAQALHALAKRTSPDPWFVVDRFCSEGDCVSAAAYGKAVAASAEDVTAVDVAKLPAYVAGWRQRKPDRAARKVYADVKADAKAKAWVKVLERTASVGEAPKTILQLRLLEYRGRALVALDQGKEGEAALIRAAEAARTIGWLRRTVHLFDRAGHSAFRRYAFEDAVRFWNERLALCKQRGDPLGEAKTLRNMGSAHNARGDFGKAEPAFKSALALWEVLKSAVEIARSHTNVGLVLRARGYYGEALAHFEKAKAAQAALGRERDVATTLANIGMVHQLRGDYDKALAIYELVLEDVDERGAASTRGNMGLVFQAQGEYGKAIQQHLMALEQQKKQKDGPGAARTTGNIGLYHESLGDYAKAIQHYGLALKGMTEAGSRAGEAEMLAKIGNLHQRLGNHPKARKFLKDALALMKTVGDQAGEARTLVNLGVVYFAQKDYEAALGSFEDALGTFKALKVMDAQARTHGNIGVVHDAQKMHAKALTHYTLARDQQKSLGDQVGEAMTRGNIGEVHGHMGKYKLGLKYLKASVGTARSLKAEPQHVAALTMLARLHLDNDKTTHALASAEAALALVEGLLGELGDEQGSMARGQHASLFAVGALAASREEEPSKVFDFFEHGRALALLDMLDKVDIMRWKAKNLSEELRRADQKALAGERVAQLAYDVAVGRGDQEQIDQTYAALQAARDFVGDVNERIQASLKGAVKLQAGLGYPRPRAITALQRALRPDQVLVIYGLFEDDLGLDEALALVIRRKDDEDDEDDEEDESVRIVSLGKASELAAACALLTGCEEESVLAHPQGRTRGRMERKKNTQPEVSWEPMVERVRKLMIKPLKLKADAKQILVSPDGLLCYLPFGLLFDGADRAVAMTPSGTTHLLLGGKRTRMGKGVLALGAPDYTGVSKDAKEVYFRGTPVDPLPETRVEAETVGTKALVGKDASESGLRAALPLSERWRAIHFACHGFVNTERPMLCSLALSRVGDDDGFLTAREIMRMQMPADLIVLSACETSRGKIAKGEGIMGLTRSFMFAGSPRVLCSLWPVEDKATRALMIEFYRLWNPEGGSEGLGAAEALRQAQAFIRGQEKWAHPYYWAAWSLWGLPN